MDLSVLGISTDYMVNHSHNKMKCRKNDICDYIFWPQLLVNLCRIMLLPPLEFSLVILVCSDQVWLYLRPFEDWDWEWKADGQRERNTKRSSALSILWRIITRPLVCKSVSAVMWGNQHNTCRFIVLVSELAICCYHRNQVHLHHAEQDHLRKIHHTLHHHKSSGRPQMVVISKWVPTL